MSTTTSSNKSSIAIIGGGPGGLMLARLLHLSSIPFTIFERDSSPDNRQVSGTLDVHPGTGQAALKQAGLLDQFNGLARFGVRTRIVDSQAKKLVDLDEAFGELKAEDMRPEIDRIDLQRILQGAIPLEHVRWGSKVRDVRRNDAGAVAIHLDDGSVESGFRLVVGADGAWSKVRSLFTAVSPQYAGITFLGTNIRPGDETYSSVQDMVGTGNYLAMQGVQKVFIYYLGDKSYCVYVGSNLAQTTKLEEGILEHPIRLWEDVLKSDFEGWTTSLTDLVTKSARGFRPWVFNQIPKEALDWKPVSGATMLGDAVHLT
jgi:2-polyprenyl-6-methoxyphenol hydroxylase-like FAD-dependent oxidoreductase